MTRRAPLPLARLAPHLAGLAALDAARALAHPTGALARALAGLATDRARLIVDAFEERAGEASDRKRHGVFYTPPEVVEAMLDRLSLEGRIVDPAAGAGAFVLALARRLGVDALARIEACDIDACALDACALALEVAFGPEHRADVRRWRLTNCHVLDFLRDRWPGAAPDLVVGNPPYGLAQADDLPARFPELRGELDLFACFVLRALAIAAGTGTVGLLVPDTWLTNRRAASLRETLLERSDLAAVVDFGKPFATARDTRVHALVLRRGAGTCEVESTRDAGLVRMAPVSREALAAGARRGWFLYRTSEEVRACAALERGARPLGEAFEVIYGLRTGSNATHVRAGAGEVPLVGGLDFEPFDRHVTARHLVDPPAFARLVARQRGRWRLGIQRIRTNSRLPWRRWLEAAPVLPDEVGLDSLTLVADRESALELSEPLCGLLGVLNSSVLNRWYRLSFTDVNVKPAYVEELPVPVLGPEVARLVRQRLGAPGDERLERAIDRLVADAYGLSPADLGLLERAFWGDELARRPLPSRAAALALARDAAA